jgi:hypothetical protein
MQAWRVVKAGTAVKPPAHSAQTVLSLIEMLPDAERSALMMALEMRPDLPTGFRVLAPHNVEIMNQANKAHYGAALAKALEKRNRPSDPKIIRRNAKICDEHEGVGCEAKSFNILALDYELSRDTIKEIWKERLKWRFARFQLNDKSGEGVNS